MYEPVHQPTHRGRGSDDGQDPLQGFEYRPYEAENPLSIDPDIVRSIEREWGYSLLWVCYECNGRPFPNLVSARKRNGYAEVKKGNFGGGCRRLNAAVISEIFFAMQRAVRIDLRQARRTNSIRHALSHPTKQT